MQCSCVDDDLDGYVATVQLPDGRQVALPLRVWNQMRDMDYDQAMTLLIGMLPTQMEVEDSDTDGNSDDDDGNEEGGSGSSGDGGESTESVVVVSGTIGGSRGS